MPSSATSAVDPAITIVEYLERQHAVITRLAERADVFDERQLALPGHAAEMPAPRQRIHGQLRRIGNLHMEKFFAPDRVETVDRDAGRERTEGIEREPDRGVIDLAHDFPGVAVIADVPAPGQRLECHAQSACGSALAELPEIVDDASAIGERSRRDVGAHQHQVRAELLQHVELAFRAIEHARAFGRRHSFEVAEWLERHAGEPQVAHHGADDVHRFGGSQQVALEDLHVLEAGIGYRAQLGAQRAVDGNGGDAAQQLAPPATVSSTPMPSGSRNSSCCSPREGTWDS